MTNLFSIKAVFRTNRKRQRDDVFSLYSTTRQVSVLTTLDNLSLRGHGVLGKVLHCRLGSIPALLIYVFPPTGLRLFERNGASPNATTINQVKVAKRLILRLIRWQCKRPSVRGFNPGIFLFAPYKNLNMRRNPFFSGIDVKGFLPLTSPRQIASSENLLCRQAESFGIS